MKRPQTHGTARLSEDRKILTITVKGKPTEYAIADTRPDPRVAAPAFALTKKDGEVYHVAAFPYGHTCTCADYHWCREYDGGHCKHIVAMISVGLLAKE